MNFSCSKWFLLGSEIGSLDLEKKLRFCEYCFQGYQNFLKLKNNHSHKNTESFSQFTNYLIKEKEDNSSKKHRIFFTEPPNIPFLDEKQNEIIFRNIEELITFIFKYHKIYDKWYKLLINQIEKAVKNVLPNTILCSDSMDINNYVKIKKIPYEDETFTNYINGVLCRKNISDKKMRSNHISPKILIATQIELVGNSDLTMFDNLIHNEKKQIKKIIDKIMKLKPNVILIEKSINRIAYEYFKEADIIIIIKIKHELLKRIARVTKATIIKNLSYLDKIPEDKLIGTCEKLYIKKFFYEGYQTDKTKKKNEKNNDSSLKNDKFNDPFYLFIEVIPPYLGSTIIISGPNDQELNIVKESLKLSLKLARNSFLEKDLVINETILLNQINIESYKNRNMAKNFENFGSLSDDSSFNNNRDNSQKNKYKREGDFSTYLFNKMPMEDIISKQFINYTKVCYVKGFLENCNEICANEEALKFFYENFGEKNKRNEISPFNYFVEICELPSTIQIEYYSDEDLALGKLTFFIESMFFAYFSKIFLFFLLLNKKKCLFFKNNIFFIK